MCHFFFWITPWNIGQFRKFPACSIKKKPDVNERSIAHFTLILSLHYLLKCRSRSLAIYNNEFILGSSCSSFKKIAETTKSFLKCDMFNINHIYFKILHQWTDMTHQRRLSRSRSYVIERVVGESHQHPFACIHVGGRHFEQIRVPTGLEKCWNWTWVLKKSWISSDFFSCYPKKPRYWIRSDFRDFFLYKYYVLDWHTSLICQVFMYHVFSLK